MAEVSTIQPTRNVRRELVLLIIALAALSVVSGIFEPSFNNFLNDAWHISAGDRGKLELPREFPGFLVALLGGVLFFLSEVRLGIFAASCVGLGLFGLAFFGDNRYLYMMIFMIIWSMGSHLMIPISTSLQLSLAPKDKRAGRLGQVGGITVAAAIIGSSIVWYLFRDAKHLLNHELMSRYTTVFIIGGAFALVAALVVSFLHPPRKTQRPKLVIKRHYSLYYLLCVFSGARKQIFITFGPWVLIKIYGQNPAIIAQLWIIASLIGIVFLPLLGRIIDRVGERKILMFDAVVVFLICFGYAFPDRLAWISPVTLLCICYVIDSSIFACSMARATYVDKIAEDRADVHASLSIGVTIDHAVSMSLPWLGGKYLWDALGFQYVFMAAAFIAVMNFIAASFVRVPHMATPEPLPETESVFPD